MSHMSSMYDSPPPSENRKSPEIHQLCEMGRERYNTGERLKRGSDCAMSRIGCAQHKYWKRG
jgi:hypothetical protein